jgi:hypothetical protein
MGKCDQSQPGFESDVGTRQTEMSHHRIAARDRAQSVMGSDSARPRGENSESGMKTMENERNGKIDRQ